MNVLLTTATMVGVLLGSAHLTCADSLALEKIERQIKQEPDYSKKPWYCLLVFGEKARTHIWLVLDDKTMYVDRNANGDLTEPGEMVLRKKRFVFDIGELFDSDGKSMGKLEVKSFPNGGPAELSFTLPNGWQQHVGFRVGYSNQRFRFSRKLQWAPIIHLNGPLQLKPFSAITVLPRKLDGHPEMATSFRIFLGTPGIGKATFAKYSCQAPAYKNGYRQITAEIEFKNRQHSPKKLKYQLSVKESPSGLLCKPINVPAEVAGGIAKITLSIPDWPGVQVKPCTIDGLVIGFPDDVAGIKEALKRTDKSVRYEIISAIQRFGDRSKETIELLVSQCSSEPFDAESIPIRTLKSWASDNKAIADLIVDFASADDSNLRAGAVAAIMAGVIRNDETLPIVISRATDPEVTVRVAAVYALREFPKHSSTTIPVLVKSLSDPNILVQLNTLGTLASLGRKSFAATARIVQLMDSGSKDVRQEAANAIIKIAPERIPEIITKVTASDSVATVAAFELEKLNGDVSSNKTSVTLVSTKTPPIAQLRLLRLLPDVKRLTIRHRMINSVSAELKHLKQLEYLELRLSQPTDELMPVIAELPALRELGLSGGTITDQGLQYVKNAKNLVRLSLGGNKITDAGLIHIRDLKKLKYLSLIETKTTDAGFVHLKHLHDLERLYLYHTKCTITTIEQIGHLQELRILGLRNTAIDDNAIPLIAKLKKLRVLFAEGSKITPEGVKMLKDQLPNCRVYLK